MTTNSSKGLRPKTLMTLSPRYQLEALIKYGLGLLKSDPAYPVVLEVEVHFKW